MESVSVKDIYGDEVDVETVEEHWKRAEHPNPLVLMSCNGDMMMTPAQALKLAAALILAADECEK